MKDYSDYDIIAFALDTSFQDWVLNGKREEYWERVKEHYPDKVEEIEEAKDLLRSIDFEVQNPEEEVVEEHLKKALQSIGEEPVKKIWSIGGWRWVAAAAVLFLVGYGFFQSNFNESQTASVKEADSEEVEDLEPGGRRAILILGDGTRITLDSVNRGPLASQGNTRVLKLNEGQLSYRQEGEKKSQVFYNTVHTPAGGTYQLTLSDGTRVWLNAQSSLHFPTSFVDGERKVELEGEGYFEVAQDAARSFLVKVDQMEVKVLGTHFNIKAYRDELNVQTTLLEGKVEVSNDKGKVVLDPGQQAEIGRKNEQIKKTENVDLDKIMAWKNGEFIFEGAELREVLLTLSRWYDFEVDPPQEKKSTLVYGSIKRDKKLSEVLKIMEASGIHYKMTREKGKNKLMVLKQ